jgi:hypothetical protein
MVKQHTIDDRNTMRHRPSRARGSRAWRKAIASEYLEGPIRHMEKFHPI